MQIRYNAIRSIVQTSQISTSLHFVLLFLLTLKTVAFVEIIVQIINWKLVMKSKWVLVFCFEICLP